ncbi:VOC family protein [Pseudomonas paraeruginosa]|uniref:VOC family protein n=1 Tax=Pseudomonas paraeruginosa TaxID=2994495 RepID=UPI0039FCF527
MSLMPFHLAIPVHDLPAARRFYGEVFGLSEGRSAEHWVDFDFFGHQLVIHQHPQTDSQRHAGSNPVDGYDVPVPHFGVVLAWDDWHALAERLKQRGTRFVIEPYIRFKGQVGEQATLFLLDPCGNALEFKSFRDMGQLFAR